MEQASQANDAGRATGPRPSVMSLSIRDKPSLYASYMAFVDGGGLFIPTTRPARLGDEVYALLSLMDDPAKLPIPGTICWITPAGVPGRPQGIGVRFSRGEAGEQAKMRIETLLGGALTSDRNTHTI